MSSIIGLSKNPERVEFKIKNDKSDYEIALINGLRRVILVNLVSCNIDRDSVNFFENTSVFCDDFLTHRLSLLPLNVKEVLKMDLDEIEIFCDVKNDDYEVKNVYPKDFEIHRGEEKIDLGKVFILDNVLFARLKNGERLSFICKIKKGTSKKNSSSFSLCSKVVYSFENDEKIIKEELSKIKDEEKRKEFLLLNQERYYLKNKDGLPSIFKFEIESDGMVKTEDLFKMGCDYLLEIMNEKIELLKNVEDTDEISIEVSKTNMEAFDVIFTDSDDTLGNIIQSYGIKDKEIKYIGYRVPHPLDRILYVRIALEQKNTEKDVCNKIMDILKIVVSKVSKLRKDYG